VTTLIAVAAYVSVGRYYIGYVEKYQNELLEYVTEFTELSLNAKNITGRWSKLSPVLTLESLTLFSPDEKTAVLTIENISFQLDLFGSLVRRSPQVKRLHINGVECSLEEIEPGQWQLEGFENSSDQGVSQDLDKIINLLLSVDGIELTAAKMQLQSYQDDRVAMLSIDEISLAHSAGFRRARLKATFENTDKPLLGIVESLGDPRDDSFQATAYLKLDNIDFKSQLPIIKSLGFDLQDAQIDSEIWLDWKPSREIAIQGIIRTPHIDLAAISGEPLRSINDFKLDFRAEKTISDEWNVWLPKIEAQWNENNFSVENLFLGFKDSQVNISLPELQLQDSLSIAGTKNILPDSLGQILNTLNPQGVLTNLHILLDRSLFQKSGMSTNSDTKPLFHLMANMEAVNISPLKGAPGATGIRGYLEVKPKKGMVELDTGEFTMSSPGLFEKPLGFSTVKGQLRWVVGEASTKINSGPLLFTADHGPATGLLALDIPFKKDPNIDPLMSLVIGLKDTDASYRGKFIPSTLSKGFLRWIEGSVPSGHIVNGGIVYRGSLRIGDVDDKTIQLFFDLDNTQLDYHQDWPPIDDFSGLVMIDDSVTEVTSTAATLFDLDIQSSKVQVKTLEGGVVWLNVNAVAVGQARDALRLVNESAIRKNVGSVFENWELSGQAAINVSLGLPLVASKLLPEIDVDVQLSEADLFIPDYNLRVTSLFGPLKYSSVSGISSTGMNGELYEEPLLVTVEQDQVEGISVDIAGKLDMEDVVEWSRQPALTFFSGTTDFNARIAVSPLSASKLNVRSNLQGIKIDLPEPYAKPESAAISFNLELPFSDLETRLSMSLEDQAELQVGFQKGIVQSGLLTVGSKKTRTFSESRHDEGFFVVNGEIDSVIFEEWRRVLDRYLDADDRLKNADTAITAPIEDSLVDVDVDVEVQKNVSKENKVSKISADSNSASNDSSGLSIRLRDLKIGEIDGISSAFDSSVINGERQRALTDDIESNLAGSHDGWFFSAQNTRFEGSVFIPDDSFLFAGDSPAGSEKPLLVHLTRLVLQEEIGEKDETQSTFDPSDLDTFAADVVVDDISIDGKSIGDLTFDIRPISNGIRANNIQGNYQGIKIKRTDENSLSWWKDDEGEHSRLVSQFHVDNIGDVLENWKYQRIIESDSGRFGVDLTWLNSPDTWQLKSSAGTIDLRVYDGRFLNTSDTAEGTLRVVGLINLANVLNLQSSFSNLFDSGISFDRISGQLELADERLSIIDNLSVESPSSAFQFRGNADMNKRLLDMELIVTLPVANNLPWIAALAGVGLPVAAGVYVVGKIFEKQVDRFSSGVYDIGGDWDAPELKFKRVFDDANTTKSKKKEERQQIQSVQKEVEPETSLKSSVVEPEVMDVEKQEIEVSAKKIEI
jgi:uncharacterized protein YhdP